MEESKGFGKSITRVSAYKYLMAFAFLAMLYFGSRFIKEIIQYPWEQVPCVIKSGEIVRPEHDPNGYRAEVLYSCDDPNVGTYMWEDYQQEAEAQRFLTQYRPGSQVTGYKKGSQIKLKRKPLWVFPLYLIPLVLILFSARKIHSIESKLPKESKRAAVFSGNVKSREAISGRKLKSFDITTASVLEDKSKTFEWQSMFGKQISSPVSVPKPRRAQLWKFAGLFAASIVVLSLAGYFGFVAYQTWIAGGKPGLAVAAAPFLALAGMRLFYRMIQQLLALMNPRPQVHLSTLSIWPGGSLDLDWRYEGRVGKAGKIIFSLIGWETVEIKENSNRGYTNNTQKGKQVEVRLYESLQEHEIREGRTRVKMPENMMHSLNYGSMKIEWMLKVEVRLALWADLHEEYSIVVRPIPLSEGRK